MALSSVKGRILPLIFNILLSDSSDLVKLPVMLYKAVSNRLPMAWLFKSLLVWKRYCNNCSTNGSTSLNDTNTFLKSPTAGMLNSCLSFPVEEPSSATDTIAVMSKGNSFNPRSRTDKPVPPPNTTTFFM